MFVYKERLSTDTMRSTKASSRYISTLILFIALLLAATGCGEPQPTQSPVGSPSSPIGTPAEAQPSGGSESESPLSTATPTAEEDAIPGPRFALDRPLEAGATHVSGQGPAGIPIVIVDVTLTGRQLGTGYINDEGRFDIELSEPLEAGHRIGIMAGTTSGMSEEEAQEYISQLKKWRGEEARTLPFIGTLFDTAMVPE